MQGSVRDQRVELLERGVLYPGGPGQLTHRREIYGFMGRTWGWGAPPSLKHWNALMKQVEAHPQARSLISHEYACESDEQTVRNFQDALGENTHIAITARNYAGSLPSAWQQFLKAAIRTDFEAWLKAILSDPPNTSITKAFHKRDLAETVERWASVFGPENVTVLVTDKHFPSLIGDGFEDLLGLPRGMLAPVEDGFFTNRGLGVREAELVRQLNKRLKTKDLEWADYQTWVRGGVVRGLLDHREPQSKLELPSWAAELANQRNLVQADRIAASGVRVIGDLDELRRPISGTDGVDYTPDTIPIDIAVEAILGVIASTSARADDVAYKNDEIARRKAERAAVIDTTSRGLLAEVGRRARSRAKKSLGLGRRPQA